MKRKVGMRYEVRPDGTLTAGRVFFDMTDAPGDEALDGVKVDQRGNLYRIRLNVPGIRPWRGPSNG